MRAKIDITEVEHATKIRAKYLRALENEEWNLLPGSTFVKSFLREYADYLGLDARLLVEEYKLRFERPSEQELAPISPNLGRDRRGGGMRSGGIAPRWAITGVLLVVLIAALWAVGSIGGGNHGSGASVTTSAPTTHRRTHRAAPQAPIARPVRTSVQIVPTATVYVCLVDEHGKVLIPGSTFDAGQQVPAYHAKSMRITLGNNQLRLRVNGRSVAVPASSTAIAYALTPSGARVLPAAQAPTCT